MASGLIEPQAIEQLVFWLEEEVQGDRAFDTILHMTIKKLRTMIEAYSLDALVEDPRITRYFKIDDITAAVARAYGVAPVRMLGASRSRGIVEPRHVAMYLAKQFCPHATLSEIGRYFGGRDHATVLHAVNKMRSAVMNKRHPAGRIADIYSSLAVMQKEAVA